MTWIAVAELAAVLAICQKPKRWLVRDVMSLDPSGLDHMAYNDASDVLLDVEGTGINPGRKRHISDELGSRPARSWQGMSETFSPSENSAGGQLSESMTKELRDTQEHGRLISVS